MLNPAAQELWGLNIDDSPPSWLANRSLGHHPETPIDNRIVRIDIAEFGQDGSIIVTEDITKQVEDRERLYQTQIGVDWANAGPGHARSAKSSQRHLA